MKKPHLKMHNGYWRCDGSGVAAYGLTKCHAYFVWCRAKRLPTWWWADMTVDWLR